MQSLAQLGVSEERADHRRGEEAWADRVDVDALGPPDTLFPVDLIVDYVRVWS